MVGRAQPFSPRIQIQSLVDCFGLGAHVCAAVAFLVMRLIWIGRNDGNRLGILGSMMGTDRVRPHHLIGVDWAQNQSRWILKLIVTFDKDLRGTNHNRLHPTILKHIFCLVYQTHMSISTHTLDFTLSEALNSLSERYFGVLSKEPSLLK